MTNGAVDVGVRELSDLDIRESPIDAADIAEIVIEPSKVWVSLGLHDLWDYRELL